MGVKPYEQGVRAGSGLSGMLVLKPNSQLKLWQASYGKGTTLIRIWGDTYKNDAGEVCMSPHRDNQGNFGTSFFIQDAVYKGWGRDTKLTFMARVEDEDMWPNGSPADIFYSEINNNPDFKYLAEKPSKNDFAPVSRAAISGFVKGLLLECGGKDYKSDPIWGACLMLAQSAKEAFERLLDTENPNPNQSEDLSDPMGWYDKYVVGDPIGFKTGKIFEFNKESAFSSGDTNEADINLGGRGAGASQSVGKSSFESYGCRVWPQKKLLELPPTRVLGNDESFESAIRYMTGEEQITQVIIPGFGRSCRDAVLYVFGDKDLLPASYEFGRKTVDMGASQGNRIDNPQPEEPKEPEINLGGGDSGAGEPTSVETEVEAPSDPGPENPTSKTADNLRARLNALKGVS